MTSSSAPQKVGEVPIIKLPQKKAAQLNLAISIPPMYLSVEKFEFDPQFKAVFYNIEVGIQKDSMVCVHTISKRYSALQEFDSQIRPKFSESRYLHPFPPKKLFGNTENEFLEKRSEELQNYLGNLVRVAGLCETQVFRRFFGIDDSVIKSF
ncbi:PX domain containing protein [Trichomonas vaginalis G3]|uniref:PX domain containing protein n=1 Tax=Trichomonas vaginalis (strain ATCC PRA-98 / G3) TaxID=412133 RepID=A2EBC9_TRIV3|nr:phosphatidylinositol binding [Trichomonas vaginalis G3]EAY10074.1 PX domain containing protein [Trichomonas vaginalis G3]KAI5528476.1 phosphatidylinositol binding [Trichomonas vaginalis G3]|eukprot:XP_001322297.1 PX domain containing protein [Trichomonas vaginalis G3]